MSAVFCGKFLRVTLLYWKCVTYSWHILLWIYTIMFWTGMEISITFMGVCVARILCIWEVTAWMRIQFIFQMLSMKTGFCINIGSDHLLPYTFHFIQWVGQLFDSWQPVQLRIIINSRVTDQIYSFSKAWLFCRLGETEEWRLHSVSLHLV